MLTPRKGLIQRRVSMCSTPYGISRADSDPLKNRQFSLSFSSASDTPSRPLTVQATIAESPNKFDKQDAISSLTPNARLLALHEAGRVRSLDKVEIHNGVPSSPFRSKEAVTEDGEELNIEEALTDELKILQDKNRHLQQQIEVCVNAVITQRSEGTSQNSLPLPPRYFM